MTAHSQQADRGNASKRRIFISTGEVSGDLQGALLVEALLRQAQVQGIDLEILALGGDRMAQAGAVLLGDTTAIGSVGLVESLPYVWPTLRVQQQAKRYLKQHPPDLVVMIDYMSPNIAIGNYVKRQLPQVPTAYYIAPQEWVWSLNARNTNQIVGFSNRILAIFPEEARYYQSKGAHVTWVGHPLVDRIQDAPDRQRARSQLGISPDQPIVTLIPASRRQELRYLLPVIAESAHRIQSQIPTVQFWVPLAFPDFQQPIEQALGRYGIQAQFVDRKDGALAIAAADLAITKSGTVNLELALMQIPQVVLYRVNSLTAWVAEHVLKFSIPFMSPPNLVMMREIVPEFLQYYATPEAISQAALELLQIPERRQQMLADYGQMRQALGETGVCDRAAQEILTLLPQNPSKSLSEAGNG
jgi:lipid-A-disaccharide synthase